MDYPVPTRATARTFWGEELEVFLPELVSCELHAHGLIEPDVTALFIDTIEPGDIVYDVGAHVGYYSLLGSALGATVHAFEPARTTERALKRNVGDGAVVTAIGLWDGQGKLEFRDFGDEHSAVNTFLSSKDDGLTQPAATYEVPVTTLDLYVRDSDEPPSLIKLDAEGAELQVLRGGATVIRSARPLIAMEVGDTDESCTSRRAIEFALELGYDAFDLDESGLRPHELQDKYSYANVVLMPRS